MVFVDARDLRLLFFVAAMVGEVVMAVFHLEVRIGAIAAVVGVHEGDHARRIGLEGQRHQVHHQLHLIAEVARLLFGAREAAGLRNA
jgi:hypothetical protein